jgi:hypothetical protein
LVPLGDLSDLCGSIVSFVRFERNGLLTAKDAKSAKLKRKNKRLEPFFLWFPLATFAAFAVQSFHLLGLKEMDF